MKLYIDTDDHFNTINGYPISRLILLSVILSKKGFSPIDVDIILNDVELMVQAILDDIKEVFENSLTEISERGKNG
mgnify:CR=1 FL=1